MRSMLMYMRINIRTVLVNEVTVSKKEKMK